MEPNEIEGIAPELELVHDQLARIIQSNDLSELVILYVESLMKNIKLLSGYDGRLTERSQEIEMLDVALKSLLVQNRFFWRALVNAWDENPVLFDEASLHSVNSNIEKVRAIFMGNDPTNISVDYAW